MLRNKPEATIVTIPCDWCQEVPVQVKLDWWHSGEGTLWVQDTVETVSRNDRLCPSYLDSRMDGLRRARELSSDVPPAWFDPTYAGERWSED